MWRDLLRAVIANSRSLENTVLRCLILQAVASSLRESSCVCKQSPVSMPARKAALHTCIGLKCCLRNGDDQVHQPFFAYLYGFDLRVVFLD